ncbi:MAG: alpha/beta hydrolase [Actinomycetes bacterium]
MPLMPGAEPFRHDGGQVGALLCHGFTGTPQSLRPWAEYLAAADLTVRLPRLPGHGTTVQEANLTTWHDWYGEIERSFLEMSRQCDQVFVMGLSMGGTLAIRLAEEHGDAISGLVLVNPSLLTKRPDRFLLPALRLVVPTWSGIASDIKKPGSVELAYDRIPMKAAYSLSQLWTTARGDLAKVTQPILLMRSTEDHVVEPDSSTLLREKVSSTDLQEVLLEDSYHVATLDNDAPTIFAGSLEFVRRLARASA